MTASTQATGSSTITLGANNYGKARVRLVKVTRTPGRHVLKDLTVHVALEGDFVDAHVTGDQANVVATDTMKNTVYALAKDHLTGSAEAYGLTLASHFLEFPQVNRASVTIAEHRWSRLSVDGTLSDHAFMRTGDLTRTAVISTTREGTTVDAGIEDLVVLKTTKSAFAGFPRDRFTTLKDTDDRILATKVTASWRYEATELDFDATYEAVTKTILDVFADHFSPAVQTSIWLMGKTVLERHPTVSQISFALPNLHHWLVDLSPFGMINDKEIYVATTEPYGLIEATIQRSTA
jgi:urate oxidase